MLLCTGKALQLPRVMMNTRVQYMLAARHPRIKAYTDTKDKRMSQQKPRVPALPRAEWSDAAHDALTVMGLPPAPKNEESKSTVTRVLANHPALSKAVYTLGAHILMTSTLPARLREIAILRVTWLNRCQYEWAHHNNFAQRAGISIAEIETVKHGAGSPTWSDSERAVLQAVDQLCEHTKIDDATWQILSSHLQQQQLMDLLFTVGHYIMMSGALNSMQIQLEPELQASEYSLPS
jgi:4-carboxymuconolactone decarboxylase